MKAIIHARIYDYKTYIENGYILYDQTILEVGKMADFTGCETVYDAKGMLLIPGLINGHTHIYSSLFRGSPLNASPENFMEILEQIWWRFDRALTLDTIKESAKAYGQESLMYGVTSMIDHHASGEITDSLKTIHETLKALSIKHLLCFESSDRFDLKKCILENQTSYSSHFGLHASLSLSDASLECIGKTTKGKPIHIHVAESHLDQEDAKSRYDMSVVERLNHFDLLSKDSILAHCLHIDENDALTIQKKGCVVAINPTSNLNNAVGLYPQKLLQDYRIPILVGTDGLGVNVAKEYQYLYFVGQAYNEQPNLIELEWIKKQLLYSYDYFSKHSGCLLGEFKKDYISDFLLVDYHPITPMHNSNIFAHLLFAVFDGLRPHSVVVEGKWRVQNYKLLNRIEADVSIVNELWRKL